MENAGDVDQKKWCDLKCWLKKWCDLTRGIVILCLFYLPVSVHGKMVRQLQLLRAFLKPTKEPRQRLVSQKSVLNTKKEECFIKKFMNINKVIEFQLLYIQISFTDL